MLDNYVLMNCSPGERIVCTVGLLPEREIIHIDGPLPEKEDHVEKIKYRWTAP